LLGIRLVSYGNIKRRHTPLFFLQQAQVIDSARVAGVLGLGLPQN
jgi:hypothetical protein